jgi:hypothetical protein
MSHICGVSKTFGEWYQKTKTTKKKTEDTNKLTLLAFKIIAILHNSVFVKDGDYYPSHHCVCEGWRLF